MKKLIAAAFSFIMLTLACHANMPFTDVKESDWFCSGVQSAQKSGLMNGVSDTLFAPSDTLSVAQGVTVAARIHSLYGDKSIPNEFQGYDYYLDYAVKHGIMLKDYFDSTSRPIKRSELCYILDNSLDSHILTAKNDIRDIPDADISSEYYDGLLRLYNAGILGGFDKYGSFRPDNNLTRAELSVVLDRVLNPENRLFQQLEDGTNREAFYLIDDFLMKTSTRGIPEISSGWVYDYTGDSGINSTNAYQNVLDDKKTNDNLSMSRDIYPQFSGKLTLELIYTLTSGSDGLSIYFADKDKTPVFEIVTKDGFFNAVGDKELSTALSQKTGKNTIKAVIDIDKKCAELYINGTYAGVYGTKTDFDGIYSLCTATGVKDVMTVSIDHVHLYKNFLVNDVFRIENVSQKPLDYTVNGNMSVQRINSNQEIAGDIQSVKIAPDGKEKASAYKSFEKTGGKVRLEAFILLPDGNDGAYFTVKDGDRDVITVETKDGCFIAGESKLRSFSKNIWQNITIEVDTETKKALIKINGKACIQDVPVNAASLDGIEIGFAPSQQAVMWFDDVTVQRLYEYEDYVPQPKVLESDYILSMMVCSLWRNGSHYGWQYIAPFEEITPITGYYDEGNAEAMDWEIKFLTEHGFSNCHLCWYAPNATVASPIKKPRMSDALHGGYFNSKYSHLMSFSIMWENARFADTDINHFKENIWKYWCEWYFTDERYLKINGKPFLSIYNVSDFYKMCGNDSATAKSLIYWMNQDIKNYGFDGIIIAFSSTGQLRNENEMFVDMGINTVHTYARGSAASDGNVQKIMIDQGYSYAKNYGINPIAVASAGFNPFAWNMPKVDYMKPQDFEGILTWIRDSYLTRFDDDSYLSKLVMFDNWNEFGEGHYLYPASIGGFGYLDAAARVFCKDNSFDSSVNILPTTAQKRRIGTLFPAVTTHLKRNGDIKQKDISPQKTVLAFDFSHKEMCSAFTTSNMKAPIFDTSEKAFAFEAVTPDPIMWYGKQTSRETIVNANEVDVIHVRMKCSTLSQGQIFFVTDTQPDWDEAKSFKFQITSADTFVDYYIDTKSNRNWKGQIKGFRVDPHSVSGASAWLKTVEFMEYNTYDKPFEIKVDNIASTLLRDEVTKRDDGELDVCFKHESGLFNLLVMSYRYNRHKGVLSLDTKYGTTFEFTAESDTVLVDGKQEKLKQKIQMYDGTMVLPMLYILDKAGYDYVYAPDQNLLKVYVNIIGQEKVDNSTLLWEKTKDGTKTVLWAKSSIVRDSIYTFDFDIKTAEKAENITVSITIGEKEFAITVPVQDTTDTFRHVTANVAVPYLKEAESRKVSISANTSFEANNIIIHRKNAPFSVRNGDAQGEDRSAFYSTQPSKNTVEAVTDPYDSNNKVWQVKNLNTASQSWSYIRHDASFEKGVTYEVEFDVRIISLSDGKAAENVNIIINPRYYDENRKGMTNEYDHIVTGATGLSSSENWTHVKKTFTISHGFAENPNVQQQFTIFAEPVNGLGITFQIDNVKISIP